MNRTGPDGGSRLWKQGWSHGNQESAISAQGVKLQVVSEVLGHASIRMTADVYGHILDPDRQAAADAMGGVLWD